jgi:hypothetical protein
MTLLRIQFRCHFGGGGRFTRTLKTHHHKDLQLAMRKDQSRALAPDQADEFLMHYLNDLLPRAEAFQHVAPHRPLFDLSDKVPDDSIVDIRLEQRQAHFAKRFLNVLFGQAALSAKILQHVGQAALKILEHGLSPRSVRFPIRIAGPE